MPAAPNEMARCPSAVADFCNEIGMKPPLLPTLFSQSRKPLSPDRRGRSATSWTSIETNQHSWQCVRWIGSIPNGCFAESPATLVLEGNPRNAVRPGSARSESAARFGSTKRPLCHSKRIGPPTAISPQCWFATNECITYRQNSLYATVGLNLLQHHKAPTGIVRQVFHLAETRCLPSLVGR
jgi:hypothetical protein